MITMVTTPPRVVILAGPNGAGKSTSAAKLLLGPLQVTEFVIAQGLSAFSQQQVAIEAGRIMLRRRRDLASARESFAFETTLASVLTPGGCVGCRRKAMTFISCFSG